MDVSVIIVNYYSERLISECVESVVKNTEDISYEIIIVDNGSDDQGKVILNSLSKESVRVVDAEANLGFGKANNLGAEYAHGDYLFLLNPDTILMNNAIRYLYDFMEKNENCGVCGGNLYAPDAKPTPSFCREFDTLEKEKAASRWITILMGKVADVLGRKKHELTDEFNYTESPLEVAYVFGADMFIKKELFDTAGGFDRAFFMYAEEAELQYRISKMGYKIICVPQSKIIHLEGATSSDSGRYSPKQFAMRMKGKLTYFDKCFPPDGAARFYNYRRLRQQRLMRWQELKGKKAGSSSIDILDKVYAEYCSERES